MQKVYWHLPGFCSLFKLNRTLIQLMKQYPEKFKDGYEIGSVYGTFPGAIWNGGRAVFGSISRKDIKLILEMYNEVDIPVRFTWTNSLLEEKHLNDTFCNMIMELADNGKNQVLVNRPVLEDYLKATYGYIPVTPESSYADYLNGFKKYDKGFAFISSTTKRLTGLKDVKKELEKDFALVVLDYDLNCNEEALKELEPYAGRIEILVDEICFPNCPKRKHHYADESLMQLTFDRDQRYDCPNTKIRPSFAESMKRPHFISNEKINSYIDRGFVNFKLIGRGLPVDMVVDSYLYYLVKEEHRDFIKDRLTK